MADDGLVRVGCGLHEYDEATDGLAPNVLYRRRKGSVPSAFERSTNAAALRTLEEKLAPKDLAAAFQRAATQA